MIIVAKVTATQAQKRNSAGDLLYTDAATGQETTVADENEAIMINVASIKYEGISVPGVKTMKEVVEEAVKNLDNKGTDGVFTYPLFVVTDNGRGNSYKRFKITADYTVSKSLGFAMYSLSNVSTNNNENEYCRFSIDHNKIYLGNSMSLTMTSKANLEQIKASMIEVSDDAFISKLEEITGVESDYLKTVDILFGKTVKGEVLPYISIDQTGYDLSNNLGILLQDGDNGSFGDYPFGSEEYEEELVKFFNGTTTDDIYDVDTYQITALFDANYPVSVKKAIVALAEFRQDFTFFMDLGLDLDNYDAILSASEDIGSHSKFMERYSTTFDVIDPYSKKQINVTLMYALMSKTIDHFNNRSNSPFCGIKYGFTFEEAIEGTVNYIPKITPKYDRKTDMCDNLINFCSYINGVLTLETEYTSQDPYTQLTWVNNVVCTQDVIRDIRSQCPISRYSMITTDDLLEYQRIVNSILTRHKDKFESLTFEYVQDDIMKANKIFKAVIYATYNSFVQTEIFDIYSLNYTGEAVTI